MFTDQIGHLAHINARDTTLALVSTAPQDQIEALKRRMGWTMPWYTPIGTGFQEACGTTEYFALDVFLRDGDRVFLTYATRGRGVEALGSVWTFLDLTPLGRQEEMGGLPARAAAGPHLQLVASPRLLRGDRLVIASPPVAHVAGFPVEELLSLAPAAAGVVLAALRGRLQRARS